MNSEKPDASDALYNDPDFQAAWQASRDNNTEPMRALFKKHGVEVIEEESQTSLAATPLDHALAQIKLAQQVILLEVRKALVEYHRQCSREQAIKPFKDQMWKRASDLLEQGGLPSHMLETLVEETRPKA